MRKVPYIDLSVSQAEYQERIVPLLSSVFLSGSFVGGAVIETFERHFATYCGAQHAIALNSGTDALILALKALEIGAGDEVITVSNSFIATANAIEWVGAKAVFVDIAEDLLIDVTRIEEAITPRTKAIIPVHLMGLPCDMEAINAIAKRHNLYVIEDAAQSVGSRYQGKKTGTLGHIGCFSLHPLKNLGGIGDGGMVTTDDALLAERMKMLRNHGLKSRDEQECIGTVSRLDTLNAVILNERLGKVDAIIEQRRERAKMYAHCLEGIKQIQTIQELTCKHHSYHTYIIKAEHRDALQAFLAEAGIETKIHYPTLIHHQKPYLNNIAHVLIKSEKLVKTILTLPIAHVTQEDIKYVCTTIKAFYERMKRENSHY